MMAAEMLAKTGLRLKTGIAAATVALAAALALALGMRSATQQPADAVLADRFAPLARVMSPAIEAEMARHRLPAVSVALVVDGRLVWARAFGSDRLPSGPGGSDRAATLDTVYRVGSVSKLFTDIGIMQLVEHGDVDLDAPIGAYLPGFTPRTRFDRQITLRQLMSHRSGLVREPPVGHYFDASGPSLEATVASLNHTTLVYEPESRTKYSNAGIATVGYVLERLAGRPFSDVLQDRVLAPLAMDSSAFVPTPRIEAKLADALMWGVDGREFPAPTFELGMAPAGSMYATVGDLARFMIGMLNGGRGPGGRVLEAATIDQMWTPQFGPADAETGYGIGFNLSRLDGRRRVGHGGAIYGFATELAMLPEQGIGVVVAATRDIANPVVTDLADSVLRAALAVEAGERIQVPAGIAPLYAGLADSIASRAAGSAADRAPPPAAPEMRELIGEYGWDFDVLFVFEQDGRLMALIEWFFAYPLEKLETDRYRFPAAGLYDGEQLVFERDAEGVVTAALLGVPSAPVEPWGVRFPRRVVGTPAGETFKIDPVRPVEELRREALAASPPRETPADGEPFREPDLVDLAALDPDIKLDIRYAGTDNFMGAVFYEQARAFMQRPAAEALARAHRALAASGYGLLIHDAYRPWYVTKMFWDATPAGQKAFVADPATGSRHNRGAAVDLTLYDLQTGEAVEMVGGYDEFSERSYPDYPGGTSRQRWRRRLLREAMEAEGFTVYEFEWWHFDYRDWSRYRISNLTFDQIDGRIDDGR